MAYVETRTAQVVGEDDKTADYSADKFAPLAEWIMAKLDAWRAWRDSNYAQQWDEYERLWRGIWSPNERLRKSERSRIVTPALSEAVENAAAEIEEAVFGRGSDYFDVEMDRQAMETVQMEAERAAMEAQMAVPAAPPATPDGQTGGFGAAAAVPGAAGPAGGVVPGPQAGGNAPILGTNVPVSGTPPVGLPPGMPIGPRMGPNPAVLGQQMAKQVERLRESLREDLQNSDFAANVVETVLYSAVFGTGFGEILMVDRRVSVPTPDGLAVREVSLPVPSFRALSPRAVLVDPNAKRLEEGLGLAVEEVVPLHKLLMDQKAGTLRAEIDIKAGVARPERDTERDLQALTVHDQDGVPVIRWYGLVPTRLLFPEEQKEPLDSLEGESEPQETEDGDYTEAIVVLLASKRCAVKVAVNPAPRGDRPVVIFPWDIVPGRLHGRGICEKGANAQKILDAEVRARLDGLALTWAPMMGMDATRIPRGFDFTIEPGRTVLTQGPPGDVLTPIKFGQLDANHWTNATALQAMVHQATGSIDATNVASRIGDARSGAVSMAMAPAIKRYKRTLVRFFDVFLMPTLDKIVSRAQQSMPNRYPAVAVRLRPASTMGIMQREYETAQLTQLLASLQPGTPEHKAILASAISNTSIPNRERIAQLIEKAPPPQAQPQLPPELAQAAMMATQLDMAEKAARVDKLRAEAQKVQAEAATIPLKMRLEAIETSTKGLYSTPEERQAQEFDRRMAIADRLIEQQKIAEKAKDRMSNERITAAQMQMSAAQKERDRQVKLATALSKQKAQPKGA